MGYHPKFAIFLFLKRAINHKKIQIFFWQLTGFLNRDVELYDEDFRKFVRKMQADLLNKKIKRILSNNSKEKV